MRIIAFLIVLSFTLSCLSQKAPFKFGKLSSADYNIKECTFFPEAKSMILGEYGFLKIVYNDQAGRWNYEMDVIVRKKIFKKEDKDEGSIKIRIYSPTSGSLKEDIKNLKGLTYNSENGKLEKTKLDKSSIFRTKLNEYFSEVSFTLPNVQEGSVLEYSYTISSDFINSLRTWNFQKNIPVAYSELIYRIPEYFNYQISQEGSVTPIETSASQINETFTYSYLPNPNNRQSSLPRKEQASMNSVSSQTQLIVRNQLPVLDEPFMNNRVNIPNRIEFQLESYQMPGQIVSYVAGSYEKFNKELLDRSDFGKTLNHGTFIKEELIENAEDKVQLIHLYYLFQKRFKWNGYNGFTSNSAGRKAFKDQEGDVADINLTFIAACREAGLKADPVILSTRGNGIPHPVYPAFDRFNYVIVSAQIDGMTYLLDPSSNLPFGSIPLKCRNSQGWTVANDYGYWVDLKSGSEYQSSILINYEIDEESLISKFNCKDDGYKAFATLNNFQKLGEESYFQNLEKELDEWIFDRSSMDESKWGKPVKYSFEISQDIDDVSTIYLTPLLTGVLTENPFKREIRMSPIDFAYSQNYRVIAQINLPTEYTAEIPASSSISLPENAGSFTYIANQNGQKIQIMSTFKLNKTDFNSTDYAQLKHFYQLMVDKNKEVVVIKKGL